MAAPAVSRASALLLASLAACSFDARFTSGYRCGDGDTCPSGEQCVAGRCTSDGDGEEIDGGAIDGDGSVGVDAPISVDDAAVPRFADDFSDGVLDGWMPWTHSGCTVMETGGAMQLDYVAGTSAYCGVDTATSFDLRTGAVSVEVVEAPAVANFEAYVVLFSSAPQQEILMIRVGNDLNMRLRVNGSATASKTIADPGDRFWRIHQNGSATIWETSDDGVSWTERHSTTEPIDASAMFVELAAGGFGPGPSAPARVRFDRLTVD